ncbi:MAG: serine/threonine-protein kinase [Myxococcota bacterium]
MFDSGDSKLFELPPELMVGSGEAQEDSFVTATSRDELAKKTALRQEVVERALMRGDIFAHYRILGFIAAGGMGEIYASERLSDDGARRTAVALKVLHHDAHENTKVMRQLEREAAICRSIRSRHVVRIYEYGYDETGRCYIAMEMLRGEELFERMKSHSIYPLHELAEVAVQILSGLHSIHRAGVVHRDLKPENIYLAKGVEGTPSEVVKLLDFGIARYKDSKYDPMLQSPSQLFGTPAYLSPEQCRGPKVDHRADLYSLGVILYECAGGSPPFRRDTPWATMHAHQEEPVPPLPSTVDPEFAQIIYRALAKDPGERWQSAEEFHFVLERWRRETSWTDELPGDSLLGIKRGVSTDELLHGALFEAREDPIRSSVDRLPRDTSSESLTPPTMRRRPPGRPDGPKHFSEIKELELADIPPPTPPATGSFVAANAQTPSAHTAHDTSDTERRRASIITGALVLIILAACVAAFIAATQPEAPHPTPAAEHTDELVP